MVFGHPNKGKPESEVEKLQKWKFCLTSVLQHL